MSFPLVRMRRLRGGEGIRNMVRETVLTAADLVYPMFAITGSGRKIEVPSMPGVFQYTVDLLLKELSEVVSLGIPAILLFGIPDTKDEAGSPAFADDGIVQTAVRAIKAAFPEMLVITDVCLCEYTSHGHCGVVEDGRILNDPTIELLARTALSHAWAGADVIAPSDMMDGRVKAIRDRLDGNGFNHIPIMAYSAKYASAFYGPFRDAAGSTPQFGDRRSYQMDPANAREAIREVELDIGEGADIVMVKPALAYLDVIRRVRDSFLVPVAAYNVSGEYSMIKAAAFAGWLDERRAVMEIVTGIKRAGADIILTYSAKDIAKWLKQGW